MTTMSMRERIAAKRSDIAARNSKGLRPYKFKTGITKFRILPAKDQVSDWWKDFGMLYLKSVDGQKKVVLGDREITFGQTDPIREMVFEGMKNAPDEAMRDHFKEMLGGPRAVFNALILTDPDQKADEPVLIEVSSKQLDEILAHFATYLDEDEDYDLASLKRGHVFQVEKTGSGFDTEYKYTVTPKAAPLGKAILEKTIDMDAWVTSLFENKEEKARQLLAGLGVGAGFGSAAGALSAPSSTPKAIGSSAVTKILDEEEDDDGLGALADLVEEVEDTLVDDEPEPEPEPAKPTRAARATKPAATAPASDDIDAILASLD